MIPPHVRAEDEIEAAAMEQALAMVRELRQLADATPDGHVLAGRRAAAVDRGRRFIRDRLQDVLNAQADGPGEKGARLGLPLRRAAAAPRPGRAAARHRRRRRDPAPRLLHLPPLRPARPPAGRPARGSTASSARTPSGCSASLGAERSFERAARLLREVAGLVVCDNTVRKACDRHGGLMRAWQREDPEAARPFREADGRRRVPDRRDLRQHHRRLARGAAVDLRQAAARRAGRRTSTTGTSSGCRPRTRGSPRRRSAPARPWGRSGGGRRRGWGSSGPTS